MYRATLSTLMAALLGLPTLAKCGNRIIQIEGHVRGDSSNARIVIQVTPDPNWEPQPEISIKDGTFVATVLFDATKSEGRVRDDCSRVPQTIEVALLKNGHEMDRVRLSISDFAKDKKGHYNLRLPVTLRAQ